MNYKINFENISVKMPNLAGEGVAEINLGSAGIEVTDVNLTEIPQLIKTVKDAIVDFGQMAHAQEVERNEMRIKREDDLHFRQKSERFEERAVRNAYAEQGVQAPIGAPKKDSSNSFAHV